MTDQLMSVAPDATVAKVRDLLQADRRRTMAILVCADQVDRAVLDELTAAAAQPGTPVGSASPTPVAAALAAAPVVVDRISGAATLPVPCPTLMLVPASALDLVWDSLALADGKASFVDWVTEQLVRLGCRHVAASGVALGWDPKSVARPGLSDEFTARVRRYDSSLLDLQTLRAELNLRPVSVVIDGECMTGDVHTGTQRVVLEIARGLARSRPTARVAVAVPTESRQVVADALSGTGVDVVARRSADTFDVVYRPYQMLRADELAWCRDAGRRLVVSQLDMIGFSNPYYHPSVSLFLLARNLQRSMMIQADAVTFISEFGRDAAIAECAELDESRLHVVWCGADTVPAAGTRPSELPERVDQFVLCLSATFWHKNRLQAIRTFAELCTGHGFAGDLVIAGPEPFYGRSTDAEAALLDTLDADIRDRIHYLGQTAESHKWWLLRHASAVLYPSVVEGFGLVPFEAASVGTPTLAFQGTALGEIVGAGPALIDTWDARAWADRVAEWLTQPAAAQAVLEHIDQAAQRFTWDRSAEATWVAIDRALQRVPLQPRAEEGGPLVHVGSISRGQALLSSQTLTARIGPAIARRVRNAFGRLRSMSP